MIADGRHIAREMEERLAGALAELPEKRVCFVLFGNDAASKKFIEMKSRVALRLGILVDIVQKEEVSSTGAALEIVSEVVAKKYDGVVIQLPLPAGLDTEMVLDAVPAKQDIDLLGRGLSEGGPAVSGRMEPVARAVLEILRFYRVDLSGRSVVVIGSGALVGRPVARMFARLGVDYAVIDKNTPERERSERILDADIVVSGAGVPGLVRPDMVKDGSVLIDAGTSESGGRLAGDIDPACAEKASLMTPVPGGVGPVTVVSLFQNLL